MDDREKEISGGDTATHRQTEGSNRVPVGGRLCQSHGNKLDAPTRHASHFPVSFGEASAKMRRHTSRDCSTVSTPANANSPEYSLPLRGPPLRTSDVIQQTCDVDAARNDDAQSDELHAQPVRDVGVLGCDEVSHPNEGHFPVPG